MFKLVVLSALLALASAKPSHLLAHPVAYVAAPAAVSHQSRVDVHHSAPIVHAYAAPVHSAWAAPAHAAWAAPVHTAAWAAPLALDRHTPAVVLGPHGVPLDTADVVADRAYHYAVKANHHGHYLHKRSLHVAPVAYVAAPAAVSHQSRVDVHRSVPVVHAYAAPAVHYAAPYYSHYAPLATRSYWGKNAGWAGLHAW